MMPRPFARNDGVCSNRFVSYSLGFSEPDATEELDHYLLALGKATYLACLFEKKCLWVVRIGKAVQHVQKHAPSDPDVLAFLANLDDSLLGKALKDLANLPGVKASSMALLNRGRLARNAIVHELGDIGPAYDASSKRLEKHWVRLRDELEELVIGDACISEWAHWIEEKEPPPRSIVQAYPELVRRWVVG